MKTSFNLFLLILKQTKTLRFLSAFGIVFIVCTILLRILDPKSLPTYADALWFGFMTVTTIGLGDFTVITLPARLVTVFLGVYGIFATGFICGVGASWLFEKVRERKNESVSYMLYQLEHIDDLDDQQINDLKNSIQKIQAFPMVNKVRKGLLNRAKNRSGKNEGKK